MTYHLDLPEEIEHDLTAHAAATGKDVVQLIQFAVVRFVESDVRTPQRPGLLPDPPIESPEISAPVDLPLSGQRLPVSVNVRQESRLRPDPLSVDE